MNTVPSSAGGRCPACGGTELYQVAVRAELSALDNSIFVTDHTLSLSRLICASCGRAEAFCGARAIGQLRELAKKEKYARRYVPPR